METGIKVRKAGVWQLALANSYNMSRFDYTGVAQAFVVPAGVHEIVAIVAGGQGGESNAGNHEARITSRGAIIRKELSVTPGATLSIYVGGAGSSNDPNFVAGGWNGGGDATSSGGNSGSSGGGASDIRAGGTALANRIVIAGGGGGTGARGSAHGISAGYGGHAGLTIGEDATATQGAGAGGTQSAGGTGGTVTLGFSGSSGDLGIGGAGGGSARGGGGGGGGYYGGGGGGGQNATSSSALGGGGGGGSSFPADAEFLGYNAGNGWIEIYWGEVTY